MKVSSVVINVFLDQETNGKYRSGRRFKTALKNKIEIWSTLTFRNTVALYVRIDTAIKSLSR